MAHARGTRSLLHPYGTTSEPPAVACGCAPDVGSEREGWTTYPPRSESMPRVRLGQERRSRVLESRADRRSETHPRLQQI